MAKEKTAILLMNLGGPDSLNSVREFLFNLFYDRAIINLPNPFRWIVAKIISSRRNKFAQEIYKKVGGSSPIIRETEKQRIALKNKLNDENIEIFILMRHFHPMSKEVAKKVKEYNPDKIIMLPLYPQFSTTTTGSSVKDIKEALKKEGVKAQQKLICCYFKDENFISAHADLIKKAIEEEGDKDNIRLLFSAHGLPQKIIESGDPYQWQVEQTVKAVVDKLNIENLDYKITYQSRVGPLKWIGPDTEEEIKIACAEQKIILISPIAFVSEHVETLVELDIEYMEIAKTHKVKYKRIATLGVNDKFIESLANIIEKSNKRSCPENFSGCLCAQNKE